MTGSAVILLSGGQDSTTCLFWAKKNFDVVYPVAFDYGQRHRSEVEAAHDIVEIADVGQPLRILELGVLAELGDSSLVSSGELASTGGYADDQVPEGLPTSFVPGRNLLFLSVAAAYAVKQGCSDLVIGVSQADYSGYPDCRSGFINRMVSAIEWAMPSSTAPWTVHAPLMMKDKRETVLMARELGDDCWKALGMSITCYEGRRPGCAACPSCRLRAAGFASAGLEDPALKAPPLKSSSIGRMMKDAYKGDVRTGRVVGDLGTHWHVDWGPNKTKIRKDRVGSRPKRQGPWWPENSS